MQSPALLVSALISAAPIQSYDSYKSWLVACDNALTCTAKGFADAAQRTEMGVERGAGPSGALRVWIAADGPFRLSDVRIDGAPAGLSDTGWQRQTSDEESSVFTASLAAAQSLVAKLRNASKLSLGEERDVPLDGFKAAMLRLDERQGRIGNMSALLDRGPLPPSQVPAAPPLPVVPARRITATLAKGEKQRLIVLIRTRQRTLFQKEGCDVAPTGMRAEAYALDAKQALVLIPCLMGAYQGSSIAFIAPRAGGRATRLIAPSPYGGNSHDTGTTDLFTESDFDPRSGRLSMAAKGRGLADCGLSADWIWDGRSFVLAAMTMQIACGGVEPGDWPTLYRSRQ